MKQRIYVVGYFEEWAYDRNSIIKGCYTDWDKCIEIAKNLERENIDKYKKFREIYITEIELDKTQEIKTHGLLWIENFDRYYKIKTKTNDKTYLIDNNGVSAELILPQKEEEWTEVKRKTVKPKPTYKKKENYANRRPKYTAKK